MTLKKIFRGGEMVIEDYVTRDTFDDSDLIGSIEDKLRAYCDFDETSDGGVNSDGGSIPNRVWDGNIETEDGRRINVEVTQSYGLPGPYLTGGSVLLCYDSKVDREDIGIVRDAITSSGLEKID